MEKHNGELWWLASLEAILFLSLPCWESTAIWAVPVGHLLRFSVGLIGGATVAMLCCHVGPALFAARLRGQRPVLKWIVLAWLSLGCLEWLGTMARAEPFCLPVSSALPDYLRGWSAFWIPGVFLAIVTTAVWARSWWKGLVVIGLLLGVGILLWGLSMNWPGLWVRNQFSFEPDHVDWLFVKGVLLSAAPAVVVAWRIGRIEPRLERIWLSGLTGVWLPLVLSVGMASLATEAGMNLHWRPSHSRDFTYALVGPHGRLEPSVLTLLAWTLLLPALLSAFSFREMMPEWVRKQNAWLVVPIIGLLSYGITLMPLWPSDESIHFIFETTAHEFWAWSLLVLGAVAGLTCFLFPSSAAPSNPSRH
jgi:hypothetical protein